MSTLILSPAYKAPRRPTYRLTRRGRAVVLVLTLLAVLAVGVAFASGSVATSEQGAAIPTEVVVVAPGDTLWDIAAAASDGGDVRNMMDRIEQLNALDSVMLAAGDRILVPTG